MSETETTQKNFYDFQIERADKTWYDITDMVAHYVDQNIEDSVYAKPYTQHTQNFLGTYMSWVKKSRLTKIKHDGRARLLTQKEDYAARIYKALREFDWDKMRDNKAKANSGKSDKAESEGNESAGAGDPVSTDDLEGGSDESGRNRENGQQEDEARQDFEVVDASDTRGITVEVPTWMWHLLKGTALREGVTLDELMINHFKRQIQD